jgi:hypothetical protein
MMMRLFGVLMTALLLATSAHSQTTTEQEATSPAAEKTQEQILAEKMEADQRAIESHRKAFFERIEATKKENAASN